MGQPQEKAACEQNPMSGRNGTQCMLRHGVGAPGTVWLCGRSVREAVPPAAGSFGGRSEATTLPLYFLYLSSPCCILHCGPVPTIPFLQVPDAVTMLHSWPLCRAAHCPVFCTHSLHASWRTSAQLSGLSFVPSFLKINF